jgi:hypothetical protein
MTITEAIDKGILEVTCDPWNPYARMILPEKGKNGTHGVWGKLIDPAGNLALDHEAEYTISILLLPMGAGTADPNEEGWEKWVIPDDYEKKFGIAKRTWL